jgi:hypothetical protein
MADIAQADVVVTQTHDDEDYTGQRTNLMFPAVSFGNASLTYPTYGVPLPDLAKFRLKSYIKRLYITQPTGSYRWVFDKTARSANPVAPHGTLRAYALGDGAEMSGAIPATALDLEIRGA